MQSLFPIAFQLGNLPVSWRGITLALALILAIALALRDECWMGLQKGTVFQLAAICLPVSFIGARVFFVLFAWDRFADNPANVFHLEYGGLALYGALFTGLLLIGIFARVKKIQLGRLMELLAAPLMLGIAIARWGDLINRECYGGMISSSRFQRFPFAFFYEELDEWRVALFLFESIACLLILCFLMYRRGEFKRRGDAMFMALLLYGAVRTMIESLREDSLYWGFVRISQVCSVLMLMFVTALYWQRATSLHKNKYIVVISWTIYIVCFATAFICEFYMAQENWVRNHLIMAVAIIGMTVIAFYFYKHIDDQRVEKERDFTGCKFWLKKRNNVA